MPEFKNGEMIQWVYLHNGMTRVKIGRFVSVIAFSPEKCIVKFQGNKSHSTVLIADLKHYEPEV